MHGSATVYIWFHTHFPSLKTAFGCSLLCERTKKKFPPQTEHEGWRSSNSSSGNAFETAVMRFIQINNTTVSLSSMWRVFANDDDNVVCAVFLSFSVSFCSHFLSRAFSLFLLPSFFVIVLFSYLWRIEDMHTQMTVCVLAPIHRYGRAIRQKHGPAKWFRVAPKRPEYYLLNVHFKRNEWTKLPWILHGIQLDTQT